jgi:hypothetical protein
MIQRLSGSKAQKRISIRYLLSIFILCAAVVTGIGFSSIWAETEGTETDPRFQNDAQTQHAQNIAIEAAFQDSQVIEAKNNEDYEEMNRLVDDKVADYMDQIAEMRESGMGWGNIAMDLGVHPGALGLGHAKKYENHDTFFVKNRDKGKDKDFAPGNAKSQSNGRGAGRGGGNGGKKK